MPNGLNKFLAYASVGAMKNNPQLVVKPYEQLLKQVGVLSDDGTMVNEKALKDAITEGFNNVPSVSLLGFTFDSNDGDKLIRRLGI